MSEVLRADDDVSYEWVKEELEEWIDFTGILKQRFAFITGLANNDSSYVGSPLAALLPLGKLVVGAQNKTEREILNMIGVRIRADVENTFKNIIEAIRELPGVNVDLICQVYLSKKKREYQAYSDHVKRIFGTDVLAMDMDNPTNIASKINFLIEGQTEGNIKKVIDAKDIHEKPELIIVNAIHFTGTWKYTFSKIRVSKFYGLRDEMEIEFMTVLSTFKMADSEVLNAQILQIPFHREQTTFVVILPKYRNGLPVLLKQLKMVPSLLNTVQFFDFFINVTIPRFKMGSHLDLGKAYQKMGMKEAFKGEGMKNMAEGTVFLSNAVQKAVIKITEEGRETPYVPPFLEQFSNSIFGPKQFKANHPFLFFVLKGKQQLLSGEFYGHGKPKE